MRDRWMATERNAMDMSLEAMDVGERKGKRMVR